MATKRIVATLVTFTLLTVSLAFGQAEKPSPEALQFFENKVRPILVEQCYKCHADAKHKGNLRVDSRGALLSGGDAGPALVPGQPDKSLLIKAIGYSDNELKMPPNKKLSKEQIEALTTWIKMGAVWPGAESDAPVTVRKGEFTISDKDRAHWAFQPVRRPSAPPVKNGQWVANPIDAFLLTKLEAKGLAPNPPAPRHELVRRLWYDLTGLPPTPAEMEAVLNDKADGWYEKLVDRLLDSPRYGEKWGRHWLDLVRFAETNSYERDNPKPNAWRYRDYVIRSFNQDKPYDRFIKEQLAGDELPDADHEALIATGFYRLGIWDDEPTDRELAKYDGLDDIVATTGQVFLGLTFDCARCHHHKLDPIAQHDYYRLVSFFQNINHFRNGGPTDELPFFSAPNGKEDYEQRVKALDQRRKEVQAALTSFEDEFRKLYEQVEGKKLTPAETSKIVLKDGARLLGKDRFDNYLQRRKESEALKKENVPAERALCVTEAGNRAPDTFVLARGNPHVRGDKVEPAFPSIFNLPTPLLPPPGPDAKTTGRRLVLANWIAAKDNPLTARVMVNRIWQHHFGRGLVRSTSNFGLQGDKPTHPELLDWLAAEFVQQGWRLKPLHKRIVTSNAYRMSSRGNPQALSADPTNDLFWRYEMRRLTAEEVRDSILAVTGVLNPKMYGPGIYVDIPKEVLAGQSQPGAGWGKSPPDEQNRRSIYIHVKRSLAVPILERFDAAETDRTTPVRFNTTQPTQALLMLNSEFLNKQAGVLADRLRRDAGDDVHRQVQLALHLAMGRALNRSEIDRGLGLIKNLQEKDGVAAEGALKYFCLVVLNLNELVYVD